ncbi:hypothetical protein BVY01_00740 [bacterium I07]|nr:hypothetical protein BVY01_00740 [bacterium I07]
MDPKENPSNSSGFEAFDPEKQRLIIDRAKKDAGGDRIVNDLMDQVERTSQKDGASRSEPPRPKDEGDGYLDQIKHMQSQPQKTGSHPSETALWDRMRNRLGEGWEWIIGVVKSPHLVWMLLLLLAILLGLLIGFLLVPEPPPMVL